MNPELVQALDRLSKALLEAQGAVAEIQTLALHSVLDAPPIDEAPLTVEEAASRLNLSVDRTREKLKSGEIKARKVGRRWAVLPSDLHAYLRGES